MGFNSGFKVLKFSTLTVQFVVFYYSKTVLLCLETNMCQSLFKTWASAAVERDAKNIHPKIFLWKMSQGLFTVDINTFISFHTEKSNKMQQCIKIYYSIFIGSSTCSGRHTAHHQEPKTALAASGLHTWKFVGRVVAGRCQALHLVGFVGFFCMNCIMKHGSTNT